MRVLVVGSGGREHALCWSIARSPFCKKLYCAPGNAGTGKIAENLRIMATDINRLVEFAVKEKIDFCIVGPEKPLVAGLVDRMEEAGIKCFGPTQAAARIEGSKSFMKDLCRRQNIPTGAYASFDDPLAAKNYITENNQFPIVIKADGLAAGKGVIIAETLDDAMRGIDQLVNDTEFKNAAKTIVVEEFLKGEEVSFFALVDGEHTLFFGSAQDHKRVGEGDTGPNTGGMGAYSPAPFITPELENEFMQMFIDPAVKGLKELGTPFVGFLFAGIMMTEQGPKLLEYNARMGDPETEVIILRLMSDLLPTLMTARAGGLDRLKLSWYAETALTVVMAANGYPGVYKKGTEIRGIERAEELPDVHVFHAGTMLNKGDVVSNSGRVLAITAMAKTVEAAQALAYKAASRINWPGGFFRKDIGWRAVKREKGKIPPTQIVA